MDPPPRQGGWIHTLEHQTRHQSELSIFEPLEICCRKLKNQKSNKWCVQCIQCSMEIARKVTCVVAHASPGSKINARVQTSDKANTWMGVPDRMTRCFVRRELRVWYSIPLADFRRWGSQTGVRRRAVHPCSQMVWKCSGSKLIAQCQKETTLNPPIRPEFCLKHRDLIGRVAFHFWPKTSFFKFRSQNFQNETNFKILCQKLGC